LLKLLVDQRPAVLKFGEMKDVLLTGIDRSDDGEAGPPAPGIEFQPELLEGALALSPIDQPDGEREAPVDPCPLTFQQKSGPLLRARHQGVL